MCAAAGRGVGLAEPEEKRCVGLRAPGLEFGEVGELGADGVFFPAGDLDITGGPRFAAVPEGVAGGAEELGEDGCVLREAAPEVGAFAELVGLAAGEQAGARG